MIKHLQFLLITALVLITINANAQNKYVTPEQTAKECAKIEKRVFSLLKKHRMYNPDVRYELFPIFWLYGNNNGIFDKDCLITKSSDIKKLCFSYLPLNIPYLWKHYPRCTVLISGDGNLVAIADATLVQPVVCPDLSYCSILKEFLSGDIDIAFSLDFKRIYYLKGNELKVIEK